LRTTGKQNIPERDELKTPLGELIETWRREVATRAQRGRTFARSQDHFDTFLVVTEPGVLIDKTSETMAALQDRWSVPWRRNPHHKSPSEAD
jgi:hypothetical protein